MNSTEAEKELLKLMKSKGYSKISINIPKETLELIDEYVKLISGINRSLVINGVLSLGFANYLDSIKKGVEKALEGKLEDEKDRPKFIKFVKDLKKFRERNPKLK